MQFLFDGEIYPLNSGFWTAVLYRLRYGESIYDMQKDAASFADKLINLLYVSIQGEKPPLDGVQAEAMREGSNILPFCIKLYEELTKSDKIFDKFKKDGVTTSSGEDFDELTILVQFSKTTLPERILDHASLPQVVGLMCEFGKEHTGYTAYKKMTGAEIAGLYGKRRKAGRA